MQVDQDAFCFTLPHLVTASIKGDDPARSRYIIKSLHRLQQCLENGAHGLQGTAAWAAKSPLVREDLMRYSTEHRVVDMAKVTSWAQPISLLPCRFHASMIAYCCMCHL